MTRPLRYITTHDGDVVSELDVLGDDESTIIARTPRRTTPTRPPARLVADELGYVGGRWEPGEGS
jgi:hypothetical protein